MVEFHRDRSTVLVFGLCKQLHNIGRRCGLAERGFGDKWGTWESLSPSGARAGAGARQG